MVEAAPRDPCDLMQEAIGFIERDIASKQELAETLARRIEKLQAAEEPDAALIDELSADVRELERQLESDRAQLTAFQEEWLASCGPRRG